MDFEDKKIRRILHFVAIIAVAVTLYYLYWRIVYTFNPNAPVFSWALYGAEVFGAVTTFLFYFTTWNPTFRKAVDLLPGRSVDIFIPTKNESVNVLRKTLLACNDLRYPHRTLILDDGNRPEVLALCEELQCMYLARETHENAKAGNINFGLKHSTAEFIAIFDADHVPLPNFIDRLIGYFKDEKVAFVQVPQEFYNIDSFQHRVDRKKKSIWGEQHLFFSLIQPGRDHWNAACFVGSCAILRRKALDDVGGVATGSLTEDMLTSIRLHAKGWSSVYHNENLAYGIAAETLKPFHIQRQRWGVGSWQVFVRANPLFIRGLTLPQRLCYFSSMIYPLEGVQKIIFYSTPPIALFTGVLPMMALDVNYLVHFVPYFSISTFGFNQMARGFGGQILLEQFSMGKYFTYLKTLVIPLIQRKRREFNVTPKGEEGRVPVSLIIPQFVVLLASFVAIMWALIELLLEMRGDSFIVAVNSFWALYNSGLAVAIIQYDYKKLLQRRSAFRVPDAIPAFYRPADADNLNRRLAVADNITEEGLSLIAIGQFPVGQEVKIDLLLPSTTLIFDCQVVQERTVMAQKHQLSHLGLRFKEVPRDVRNILSRYISESAVSKFLREYRIGSRTYIEKRFMAKKHFRERAYRALAYLPVIIRAGTGKNSYAVIKDISISGLLVSARVPLPQGSGITLDVILGRQKLALEGTVVRSFAQGNEDHPEYLLGVQFDQTSSEKIPYLLDVADKIGAFTIG